MAHSKCCPLMEDLEDAVTCQVCFQRMERPKALNCLHSFCLMCIAEMPPLKGGLLSCPICRVNTKVPEMDPMMLPTAFFINQISDILAKHKELFSRKEKNVKYEEAFGHINDCAVMCESKGSLHAILNTSGTACSRDDGIRRSLKQAQQQSENNITAESTIKLNVEKHSMHGRYSVKLEKTSPCSKKEHFFIVEEIEKEHKEGDEIGLKLRKFCGNIASPCCAWSDNVDGAMVDNTGRVLKFSNKRILDGGWELTCKADRAGVFRAIIKVNEKPVETIQFKVQTDQVEPYVV